MASENLMMTESLAYILNGKNMRGKTEFLPEKKWNVKFAHNHLFSKGVKLNHARHKAIFSSRWGIAHCCCWSVFHQQQ